MLLGIDTGGTYTDGVLLDRDSRQVLATTKTLTTHHDLKICILKALDALLPRATEPLQLVAISTTLATNAIAEGKGRPVGLFLLGYDPELVRRFNFGGRFATPRYAYFEGGHDLYGKAQGPPDLEGIVAQARAWEGEVDAFAVSAYFSPFNPAHEEAVYDALARASERPVVLGHQLASRLNSVQRATTATLNASLLAILQEFIRAMRQALDERGVKAPLMVMRGDGALMKGEVAERRPVETVHSGPAASAIGARFLAGRERALVVDIGGTTTDLAVVDGGEVRVREDGTTVGPYRTAVRAAHVRSLGLGGDSYLGLDAENRLTVGPQRVVPLSYLAHAEPAVAQDLQGLDYRVRRRPTPDHVEYWFLQREPRRAVTNDRARQALALLRERPFALPELLQRLELMHQLQFDGRALVEQGVIGRAALTPTDLLHLNGDFVPWNREVAGVAAELVARLSGQSVPELIERTMTIIAERIVAEIVSFLSGQTLKRVPGYVDADDLGAWLFEESLYDRHPYLGSRISLKLPLIGIGAPAGIFLPRVAELLNTELILPDHYRVANAVGAVAGSVSVSREAWILPEMRKMRVAGYVVQTGSRRYRAPSLEEALAYARETMAEEVRAEAETAGAVAPQVTFTQLADGAESYRLRAQAVGTPALSNHGE